MTSFKPALLLDGLALPEGPRWYRGKLWFVDMLAKRIMTVGLDGQAETIAHTPGRPSGLGFLPDGGPLVALANERRLLQVGRGWPSLEVAADLRPLVTSNLNDMVTDGRGRSYISSVGIRRDGRWGEGSLVLVAPGSPPRVVAHDLRLTNGIAITPDGATLIVAETGGECLTAFTIQPNGSLMDRRVFAHIPGSSPDGICLDAEGGVWLGSYLAHEFLRVLPGGAVTHRIPTPGRWALACALGGPDRRTLFLLSSETTGQDFLKGQAKGRIETVRVDAPGAPVPHAERSVSDRSAGWP